MKGRRPKVERGELVLGLPRGFLLKSSGEVVRGCEVEHAECAVYAAGLGLWNQLAATPIAPWCRVCDRTGCRHRRHAPARQITGHRHGRAERRVLQRSRPELAGSRL